MGLSSWIRRTPLATAAREPLGVDFNAGRARAALSKPGRNKLFPLDDPEPDLSLTISIEGKSPILGRPALAMSRKLPHAICSGYLPHLGEPREWKAGRNVLNAESAIAVALDGLQAVCRGHDGLSLALPSYLTFVQVGKVITAAEKAKIKVRGTTTASLALAAERATQFLHGLTGDARIEPTSVVIVDADEHAITASIVRLNDQEVRCVAIIPLPRLGIRLWRERLLDGLADRCVRQCRRDPRDSADAEQMLFDQLENAIERARLGQKVAISVRSSHWFQDLLLAPTDLDAFCAPLARQAADEIRSFVQNTNEPVPPRAVWLTHDAGRLPGLAAALHHNMAERTNVRVLHPEAAAAAVANLIDRWSTGELPRTHLDAIIPLPAKSTSATTQPKPVPSPVRGGN